jgi:hypothetical protein
MTGLELLLAAAGLLVTVLVVAGMILITPHGAVSVHAETADSHPSNLSRAEAPDLPPPVAPDDVSSETAVSQVPGRGVGGRRSARR